MADTTASLITIQVACALPHRQQVLTLQVPATCTAQEAIHLSGIASFFPELPWQETVLGIFGQRVAPERVLQAGDRVEVYRPLLVDPKESRRQRARAASKRLKG